MTGVDSMDFEAALPGTWHLRSWTITDGRGVSHPFGPDATGVLTYVADGRMSAIVARRERDELPGAKPRDATDGDLAQAFLSFFCYAGTWRIEGDTVLHTVDLALNPNVLATVQRRRMTFSHVGADGEVVKGTMLELSADEPYSRGTRQHRLVWQRV